MTGLAFLAAWLAVPVFGLSFSRFAAGSIDSRAGRFAFAFGAGAVVLALAMLALTTAGIPWTLFRISLAGAVPAGLLFVGDRGRARVPAPVDSRAIAGIVAAAAAVLLLGYAAATARATSADYLYFWGTKGQEFAAARSVDAAFLAEADHSALHSDYPPLLPSLYALGAIAAGRFPWGAALLSAPIFFALMVAAFWGTIRRKMDDSSAALRCAFFAALLGFGWIASDVAGNAEPPLLFFETLALGILVFGERSPSADFAASIALAGCVLTKFEGAFFALAVAGVFGLLAPSRGRFSARIGGALRLISLPAVALGGWLAFCSRHGLLFNYAPGMGGPLTFAHLSKVAVGVARSDLLRRRIPSLDRGPGGGGSLGNSEGGPRAGARRGRDRARQCRLLSPRRG